MNTEAKTILVVDDNPITARCVGNLIPRLGFGAVLAFHGEEALNHLADAQFVAVISDVDMPGMNGFELLQNIRLYHSEMPVVLMTASCNEAWREAARACGAWALLEKPVTFDHLDALLSYGAETHRGVKGMHVFRSSQNQFPRTHKASPQVTLIPLIHARQTTARKRFLRDWARLQNARCIGGPRASCNGFISFSAPQRRRQNALSGQD